MKAMSDTDEIDDFDAEGAVNEYRRIIALKEAATTDIDRADCESIAKRMEIARKEWQG